ncbi:20667_t:CDS:2, partial [Racocetra persica]
AKKINQVDEKRMLDNIISMVLLTTRILFQVKPEMQRRFHHQNTGSTGHVQIYRRFSSKDKYMRL